LQCGGGFELMAALRAQALIFLTIFKLGETMMIPTRRMVPALVMTALFPLHAGAADLKWNGFLDFTFIAADSTTSGPSPTQSKFDINGELDLNTNLGNNVSSRIDFDLGNSLAGADSARFEQAFLAWASPKGLEVKGGQFNNPLSWEAEDAPDSYQISHGQLYTLWDNTTSLSGNNVLGASVSGKTGMVTLTGALLNDLQQVAEKNSFLGMVDIKPDDHMDLKVGFVTQDIQYKTIVDINGTYTQGLFMVGGEIILPSNSVDMGLGVTATYKFSDQVMGTLRFDNVSYDTNGVDDTRSITVAVSYMIEKNLTANAELRANSSGNNASSLIRDGSQAQLELIATF
jgi:hypothetical protein